MPAASNNNNNGTPNGGYIHSRKGHQTRIQKIPQIISAPNPKKQKQMNRITHFRKILCVLFMLASSCLLLLLLMLLSNSCHPNNFFRFTCMRRCGNGNNLQNFCLKFVKEINGVAAEYDDALTNATTAITTTKASATTKKQTKNHNCSCLLWTQPVALHQRRSTTFHLHYKIINAGGVITGDNVNDTFKVLPLVGIDVLVVAVIYVANIGGDISKRISGAAASVTVIAIAIKRRWRWRWRHVIIYAAADFFAMRTFARTLKLIACEIGLQHLLQQCHRQMHIQLRQLQLKLQQGICIIRLISLKRFTQIPTTAHRRHRNEILATQKVGDQCDVVIGALEMVAVEDATKAKNQIESEKRSIAQTVSKPQVVKKIADRAKTEEEVHKMNRQQGIECSLALHSTPKRRREHFAGFKLQFLNFKLCRAAMTASSVKNAKRTATAKTQSPPTALKSSPATPARKATAAAALAITKPAASTTRTTNSKTTTKAAKAKMHATFRKLSSFKSSSQVDCSSSSNCGLVASGNATGFVTVIGNGKKCGNPLQVSSQILTLAKCVWSCLWWKCKWKWSKDSCNRSTKNNNDNSDNGDTDSYNNHKSLDISKSKLLLFQSQRRSVWSCPSSFLRLRSCLIMLIFLSSLCQESMCFHGTVKLSSSTVKSKYGLLRGIVVRSMPSAVEAYLGIPYASPPVGSLRFMPPITPSTWKNVRSADRFSAVCPQTVPIPPNGPEALLEVPRARLAQLRRLLPLLKNQSEDCLYLNIYVPYETRRHRRFAENDESNPKLSTVLFIHGESYEWNSGNPYDGSELAAHGNVIVVTINFRLGIFGFLKTGGKESAQGNFGLMDLVAGLHWLKENLPAFGGDPQSITIMGHGTGAALANILIVSPVASDLIQRAVLISGSALSPWAIQKNPLLVKRRVAEQTGCHGDMLYDDLAPCLRTKSAAELLAVTVDFPRFLVGFAPFIDGTVISPNINSIGALTLPLGSAIVSTSGIEYANFPKRDLIFGLTSVESYLDLSAQDLEFGFNETRRDRILRTFVRNNYHYHLNEIFAVLKNEYTDWEKAIRNPLSSRDATLSFLSDGHTASSLIKLGYMHSLRGGRAYFLHFKHKTMEEEFPQRTGSVRGEDVPFWFGLPVSPLFPYNYTTQEKQISRLMLRYLANFARTGNPNQSTKTLQSPSSTTSTIASNVAQQQIKRLNSDNSINPDTQSLRQMNHQKVKRSSLRIDSINRFLNLTSSQSYLDGSVTRQALDLAIIYNQRRSNAMRDKRASHRRHLRSNDEVTQTEMQNLNFDGDHLPFWDDYDVVNQLYLELGNKIEVLSHYRGHKLSMWLNLIPQLHKHSNINDQSMRHHQFADDIHNQNLYEGLVRPQLQTKPPDEEEPIVIHSSKTNSNKTNVQPGIPTTTSATTTECGVDGALLITTDTTQSPNDNRSHIEPQKDLATASTGLIGNLEVLRRLSGKQFQSYTTALVATVAVGCFLLILNILIFAGIYHQREKRARDAKTKEELQDSDTSKNSSLMKLNTIGLSVPGEVGKTTVIFGEYNCYDEKTKQLQTAIDEKLLVELPPPAVQAALHDSNWACSTSTLDLLKTKHHHASEGAVSVSAIPNLITNEGSELQLHSLANLEMSAYSPLTATIPIEAAASLQLQNKRGSFAGTANLTASINLAQFDYAVQSSDQMSFDDIEKAVKATAIATDEITRDLDLDDIPEPPPPPRSFQHQQQQMQQSANSGAANSGGGILRQSGSASASSSTGGKKRVHIQEISV